MHTVHYARDVKNDHGFPDAALSIFFSVNAPPVEVAEEAIIDNFFESLEWNEHESDPTVCLIDYGDLLNIINWDKRWVY